MNDTLTALLTKLDEPMAKYGQLDAYYNATQPLAFLSPEAKTAVGTRLTSMAVNVPRLAVGALAERLRVTGFRTGGKPNSQLWSDWLANDLDQLAGVAHREALSLGESYILVWGNESGPTASIESARQVAVQRDPASRQITAACKRWEDGKATHAVLYLPDTIVRYRSNQPGATTLGFETVETLRNPMGVVPVVALTNSDRLLGGGRSEITDLIPLVDALNKILSDAMVSSEYSGRPRRWATGIELITDDEGNSIDPYPERARQFLAEDPAAKFGAIPSADLTGYESLVRVILSQISAVSSLPSHLLGIVGDQPPSADSLRAAEASLTARAEARQATFGRSWEEVGRLLVAARTGADPLQVDCSVQWADAATRSTAQEADAVVKLFGAGLLPASVALSRLGYSDDEVAQIRTARRAEALDTTGVDLKALIP